MSVREIYVLNALYEEVDVIDTYQSLIWTERFDDVGEFELHTSNQPQYLTRLREGQVLSIPQSRRMMVVETIDDKRDGTLVFKGRSLESVLDNRVGYSLPSGSVKAWCNALVGRAIIKHLYAANDTIGQGLAFGLGRVYPPSTLPPAIEPAPRGDNTWENLLDVHLTKEITKPQGFRIYREPFTTQLYYDNYTGHDRSQGGNFQHFHMSDIWKNPYMFEVDGDVEVWRNIARDPGFDQGVAPFGFEPEVQVAYQDSNSKAVDCDWSKSGRGFEVVSSENRPNNASRIIITDEKPNLDRLWIDGPLWGKTITVAAKVQIKSVMSGTQYMHSRKMTAHLSTHPNNNVASPVAQVRAPNTVGVHQLEMTFTIPTKAAAGAIDRLDIMLWNGNGVTDNGVIWGDLCIVEHPYVPVQGKYFDGGYSPDSDLLPAYRSNRLQTWSVLTGRKIQMSDNDIMENCVMIQSDKWPNAYGGLSARMIRNGGGTTALHYARFYLPQNGNAFTVKQWQGAPMSNPQANYGMVRLLQGNTLRQQSSAKANTVTERTVQMQVPAEFDNIMLDGRYTDLGGNLYFDMMRAFHGTSFAGAGANEAVVFSEFLDSFLVERVHRSIANFANTVYVTRGDQVTRFDKDMNRAGIMRRIAHVDANDLPEGSAVPALMEAMARKAFGEHTRSFLVEGSTPPVTRYKYDEDYYLGDIVALQTMEGETVKARVVEYVFINDNKGSKSYPTFRQETWETL